MEVNNISSINCDLRNNYDKEFCNNLNPDKINNFLKPYKDLFGDDSFFDKNMFYLEDEKNQINNINKEECAKYTIENNYEGFSYKGDKNKCLLFDSHNLNNKIDENTNKYNIKTFLKTKDVVDIKKLEDQLDSSKFFEESNNYGYIYDNNIKEYNVSNIDQCMDKCIKDHNDCKSIMYLEEHNECNFFNKKIMKNKNLKNFKDYDIYTVKKNKLKKYNETINNLNNDIQNRKQNDTQNDTRNDDNYYYCTLNNGNCLEDYSVNKYENNLINGTDNMLYNCSGLYSTNPFCTNEYNPKKTIIKKDDINYSDCINIEKENNLFKQKNTYNNICKKQYGNEYIFDDNVFDKSTIIKCDDGEKIKCKLNFNNYIETYKTNAIEHFNNIEENINNKIIKKIKIINIVYILLFLFIIGLFFIMYKKNFNVSVS